MGNTDSLPPLLTEDEAKEAAGELWQQYIFDGLKNDDDLVTKQDLIESAGEALMAFQGESHQLRWTPKKKKSNTQWKFTTNQAYGQALYKKLDSTGRGPRNDLSKYAHQGKYDDFVAVAEMAHDEDLEMKDSFTNVSPLIYSVMFDYKDVFEYLCSRINITTQKATDGKYALHVASMAGNVEMCELLIKEGADVNQLDADGRFAGDWAESDYHIDGYVKKTSSTIKALKELLKPTNGEPLYTGPRGENGEPPNKYEVTVAVQMSNHESKTMNMHRSNKSVKSNKSIKSTKSIKSSGTGHRSIKV